MTLIREQIEEFLKLHLDPFFITLFGSTAKGIDREESDLDIGFLSTKSFHSYDLFIIAQKLASELDRDIDLVDLAQASTVFQAQIVSTGDTLYCSDETKRDQFEMKALKMYAKLNEERKVIIDSVKESGTIYGL